MSFQAKCEASRECHMTRSNCPDAQKHSMIQGISIETEEKYKKEIINRCRQISAVLPSLNAFCESSDNLPRWILIVRNC